MNFSTDLTAESKTGQEFPRLIGLTGLYCAGKNRVAALLEERGLPALDVDKLGHRVIETDQGPLVRRFGKDILGPGGKAIDRRVLGNKVFGKPEELAALEAIVHPAANRLTGEWAAEQKRAGFAGCVINAALLHKSSVFPMLAALVVVRAPFLVRFFRALKRDRLPPAVLVRRFSAQKDFPGQAQLFSRPADTYTIDNGMFSGFGRNLEKQLDSILKGLL